MSETLASGLAQATVQTVLGLTARNESRESYTLIFYNVLVFFIRMNAGRLLIARLEIMKTKRKRQPGLGYINCTWHSAPSAYTVYSAKE